MADIIGIEYGMNDEEYEQLRAQIVELEFQLRKIRIDKVMLIQKRWRLIYQKRIKCANIIKKVVREAISNPNTQLCKNRLFHEFHNM